MRIIKNKEHLFEVWRQEQERFRQLFGGLSETELAQEIVTSGCGHSIGQHITCMLVWMETAVEHFAAKKNNLPGPEIDEELVFTNRRMKPHTGKPYTEIWQLLASVEEQYRAIIRDWDKAELFSNKELWNYLVWTSFGHYDEHSTELEWQLAGKTDRPEDIIWTNPFLGKTPQD